MDRYQTDQNKGNNNSVVEGREKFILGIIIGTVVTSLTVFIATDYNENYTNIWSLLIIAIIIFCILAIIIVFFKETLLKKFLKITFPPYKEIANNSANLFENLALGNKLASISSAKLVVNLLVNYHFWIKLRNWTIGANIALLAIIGGFFISMLTLAQNTLLNTQNQIEEKQLIIDNSLKYNQFEGIYKLVNRIYSEKNIQGGLSKELISDIIKITNSLIPYKYMDREGKIKSNLSEEKGILLKALIEANLSEFDYENIFRYSNFSNTDLSYFNSNRKVTLKNINLSHSHISNCRLRNITFDSIISIVRASK